MLTIFPLIIIILSIGVILIIASRHIKKVSILDVSEIPEEREAVLKKSILENRLLNKVDQVFKLLSTIIKPISSIISRFFENGLDKIKNLEKKYRFSGGLPDSSKKSQLKSKEFLKEAEDFLLSGSFTQAESKYLSAIKVNPDFTDAYIGLGNTYLKMDELDQARETFEHVTKTWPQDDRGFAFMSKLENSKGNLEEAKNYLLHALSINNEIVDYHLNLAEVYLSLGDNEKALSSLQKSQGLEPNNPKILDQLFLVSVLLSNKNLAQEVLLKIKKVNPDHGRLEEFEKKIKSLK